MFEFLSEESWYVVGGGVFFVTIALLCAVILFWRGRRKVQVADYFEPQRIDFGQFQAERPIEGMPQLTCYGEPVRVVVLVVAPSGRGSVLPGDSELSQANDATVPGLAALVARDQPRIDRWPAQLSTQGFIQAFFTHLNLPGDRGKGTPWCGVAGKCEHAGKQYLLGIVCYAGRDNSLGEITIEQSGRWLDILRIRD